MKRRTSSTPRPCVCPTLEAPTGRRRLTSACSWRAVIVLKQTECCAPDRARDCRPTLLRQRASRPHLKRDPLGGAASVCDPTVCIATHGAGGNAECHWVGGVDPVASSP